MYTDPFDPNNGLTNHTHMAYDPLGPNEPPFKHNISQPVRYVNLNSNSKIITLDKLKTLGVIMFNFFKRPPVAISKLLKDFRNDAYTSTNIDYDEYFRLHEHVNGNIIVARTTEIARALNRMLDINNSNISKIGQRDLFYHLFSSNDKVNSFYIIVFDFIMFENMAMGSLDLPIRNFIPDVHKDLLIRDLFDEDRPKPKSKYLTQIRHSHLDIQFIKGTRTCVISQMEPLVGFICMIINNKSSLKLNELLWNYTDGYNLTHFTFMSQKESSEKYEITFNPFKMIRTDKPIGKTLINETCDCSDLTFVDPNVLDITSSMVIDMMDIEFITEEALKRYVF